MKPFADIVRDWQPFYSALATACATLSEAKWVNYVFPGPTKPGTTRWTPESIQYVACSTQGRERPTPNS